MSSALTARIRALLTVQPKLNATALTEQLLQLESTDPHFARHQPIQKIWSQLHQYISTLPADAADIADDLLRAPELQQLIVTLANVTSGTLCEQLGEDPVQDSTAEIPMITMETVEARPSSVWDDEFGGTMHSWRLGENSESDSDDGASEASFGDRILSHNLLAISSLLNSHAPDVGRITQELGTLDAEELISCADFRPLYIQLFHLLADVDTAAERDLLLSLLKTFCCATNAVMGFPLFLDLAAAVSLSEQLSGPMCELPEERHACQVDVWLVWLCEIPRCVVEWSDAQLKQIADATCVAIRSSCDAPSQLWLLLGLLAPTAEWLQSWLKESRMALSMIAAMEGSGLLSALSNGTCDALDRLQACSMEELEGRLQSRCLLHSLAVVNRLVDQAQFREALTREGWNQLLLRWAGRLVQSFKQQPGGMWQHNATRLIDEQMFCLLKFPFRASQLLERSVTRMVLELLVESDLEALQDHQWALVAGIGNLMTTLCSSRLGCIHLLQFCGTSCSNEAAILIEFVGKLVAAAPALWRSRSSECTLFLSSWSKLAQHGGAMFAMLPAVQAVSGALFSALEQHKDNEASIPSLQMALLALAHWGTGIGLLHRIGAIETCVTHLIEQWSCPTQDTMALRRLMGQIVTQVVDGCAMLQQTGLITRLIQKFDSWVDSQASSASPGDVCMDAEHAVFDVLILLNCNDALRADSELTAVIRHIVETCESSEARRAVVNFEDTHLMQLGLLKPLCTNLDMLMHLLTEHDLLHKLLSMQFFSDLADEDGASDPPRCIVDACSLLRHKLALSMWLIGGSDERLLPTLEDPRGPLFASLPPPSIFQLTCQKRDTTQDAQITQLVNEFCLSNLPSVAIQQTVLGKLIGLNVELDTAAASLLQSACGAKSSDLKGFKLTESSSATPREVQVAAALGARYHAIFSRDTKASTSAAHLLRILHCERATTELQRDAYQVDWFIFVIYLIFEDVSSTLTFLSKFSEHSVSRFLWPLRHVYDSIAIVTLHEPLQFLCHFLEVVLPLELPAVHSVLVMTGIAAPLVFKLWWKQCFCNILNLCDIKKYLLLGTMFGIGVPVYFTLAVFKHLDLAIRRCVTKHKVISLLLEEPIQGFQLHECFDFFKFLFDKHDTFFSNIVQTNQND